jgi:hypothetical protein
MTIVSENLTLDGVVQDPAGAEGFGRGAWVGRVGARGREQAAKVLLDEALATEAQSFGRRTYEFLAARWPSRSGALADRLNSMPRYVLSSTLDQPEWNNSTILNGIVEKEVSKLKEQLDGEIVIAGSRRSMTTSLISPNGLSTTPGRLLKKAACAARRIICRRTPKALWHPCR